MPLSQLGTQVRAKAAEPLDVALEDWGHLHEDKMWDETKTMRSEVRLLGVNQHFLVSDLGEII